MADWRPNIRSKELRETVRTSEIPVLLKMGRPGCRGCRAIRKRLGRLDRHVGEKLTVETIDVLDGQPSLAEEVGVNRVPILLVFRQSALQARLHGPGTIQAVVDQIDDAGRPW